MSAGTGPGAAAGGAPPPASPGRRGFAHRAGRGLLARALELRLGARLRDLAVRRLVRWGLASLTLLSALSALSFLARGLESWSAPLGLLLLSAAPIALLWPEGEEELVLALREADPDTTIEAFLEAPPGPARELLLLRAEDRSKALLAEGPGRAAPLAGAGRLAALALASVLALQILSLALSGRGILPGAAAPREELAASGLRGEGGAAGGAGFGEKSAGEEEAGAGPRAEGEEALSRRNEGQEGEEGLEGLGGEAEAGPSARRGEEGDEAGQAGSGEAREGVGLRPGDRGERKPGAGEDGDPPAAGAAEGEAGGTRNGEAPLGGGGEGFEGMGRTGVPSPLLEYRSRLLKILGESEGGKRGAAESLSAAELLEYERRYFGAFTLETGLQSREEAFSAMLKRRWLELRGGGK